MHKKIDLYFNGRYLHSTNSHPRCKDAREAALVRFKSMLNDYQYSANAREYALEIVNNPDKLKAYFDKA